LKKYDSSEIRCFTDQKAELGCGAFGVVRCSIHRLLGRIAVKCFQTSGGDAEKEMIATM